MLPNKTLISFTVRGDASATQMLRILNLVMDEKDFLLMLEEECYGKHRKENYTSTFD